MTCPGFEENKGTKGLLSSRVGISCVLVLDCFLWSDIREEEPMGRTAAQFGKGEKPDSWRSLSFCFPCSCCQVSWTLPFLGYGDCLVVVV